MKKKWLILVLGIAFLGIMFGTIYRAGALEKPKIAVVLKNSNSEYWKAIQMGIKSAEEIYGVNGEMYIIGNSDKEQTDLLKQVLREKPDALVAYPGNAKVTVPILNEYQRKNIPVLLIDKEVDWPDQSSFIGTDNLLLGKKAGELLTYLLQPGNRVAFIGLKEQDKISNERFNGARESLTASGISVVTQKMVPDHQATIQEAMSQIIKAYPGLKGIFAANDEIAIKVLKFSRKKGLNLHVIGADGTTKMLKYVQRGDLKETIVQNPYDIGFLSIDNALKVIDGKPVEKKINSGVDIITRDNVDKKMEFIDGILQQISENPF